MSTAALTLTEADQQSLRAYFKASKENIDLDKFAEDLGLNKAAASMRLTRLRKKIVGGAEGDANSPTTPKKTTPKKRTADNDDTQTPTTTTKKRGRPAKSKQVGSQSDGKATTDENGGGETDDNANGTIGGEVDNVKREVTDD